jgi:hypothetical protein
MSINRHVNALLVGLIALIVVCSSASSRPWKPTAMQLAADYATISDNRNNNEYVSLRWWASPTTKAGTALAGIFEKYIVISVVHWRIVRPTGTLSFDDIDTLEVRSRDGKQLTPVAMNALPPTAIGLLSTVEAGLRQSLGQIGEHTKFFFFDAGAVHACERGGIAAPVAGQTYIWDTPFPGCPQQTRGGGADTVQ